MSFKPLKDLIKEIKQQNYITIEQYEQLKYYSTQPGGFSQKNKKSNENQQIIYNALLNMYQTKDELDFFENIKAHPCKIFAENLKEGIENKNSSDEIIVVNKDTSRNIFFQWKENDKEINYDLTIFEKDIEKFLKKNKNKYSYYQGYLDFCVYFYVLFHSNNTENEQNDNYINIIQLFTELYLKDYISPFKSIGENEDIIFQKSLTLLIDIIKLLDKEIYTIFKEDNTPLCLILSWIISLFTHSINNFYVIRRILDYLLINEPINSYILTAMIIVKCLKKKIKNISEVENEEIFLTIKNINLDEIDFDNVIIQCDEFIKNNCEDIFEIQDKNKNSMFLMGDYNYKGTEDVVEIYHGKKMEKRTLRKIPWIISYQFIFVLFLIWIFVIYFFHKDSIIENLSYNKNITKHNFTEEDDEF